jgi:twitching motility protein PilT
MSTLHTIDAAKTVERIIGVFPKNEEQIIRTRLAASFRFIISQRLLPRADGSGRVAAVEILKATSRTREYIERGESEGKSLHDAMEQGETEGMQTFDNVIERMVRGGVVTKEDGMAYASNAGNLLLKLGEFGIGKPEPKPQAKQPPPEAKPDILDLIER